MQMVVNAAATEPAVILDWGVHRSQHLESMALIPLDAASAGPAVSINVASTRQTASLPLLERVWPTNLCPSAPTNLSLTAPAPQRNPRLAAWVFSSTPSAPKTSALNQLFEQWRSQSTVEAAASIFSSADLAAFGAEAASISCPPYCPGADWYDAKQQPLEVPNHAIEYVCGCIGFETGDICLDPTTAGQCAWGEGADCAPCPNGAICPGGFRLWPQPQYWSVGEGSPDVFACEGPNAERCKGWSAEEGRLVCAEGHDPVSVTCSLCKPGWWLRAYSCRECPEYNGRWSQLASAATVIVVLFVIGLVIATGPCLYTAYRVRRAAVQQFSSRKAKIALALRQMLTFARRIITLFALLLTCARYLPDSVPSFLRVPLQQLQVLLLDLPSIHPSCTGQSPVSKHVLLLEFSVVVCSFLIACMLLIFVQLYPPAAIGWHSFVRGMQRARKRVGNVLHIFVVACRLHTPRPPKWYHHWKEALLKSWAGDNFTKTCAERVAAGCHWFGRHSYIVLLLLARIALSVPTWLLDPRRLVRIGRLCHRVLFLLYPIVTVTVMETLDCRQVRQVEGEYTSMWAANPLVPCGTNPHSEAARLAWTALVLHVLLVPTVSLCVLIPEVRAARQHITQLKPTTAVTLNPLARFRHRRSTVGGSLYRGRPSAAIASGVRGAQQAQGEGVIAARDGSDAHVTANRQTTWSSQLAQVWQYYTTTNTNPQHFWYYHVLHLCQLVVAIDGQLLRDRVMVPGYMWFGWFLVVFGVCLGRGLLVALVHPYSVNKRWMRWPEASMLACLALLRTAIVCLYLEDEPGGGLSTTLSVLTLLCFIVTCGLMIFYFMVGVKHRTAIHVQQADRVRSKSMAQPPSSVAQSSESARRQSLYARANPLLDASYGGSVVIDKEPHYFVHSGVSVPRSAKQRTWAQVVDYVRKAHHNNSSTSAVDWMVTPILSDGSTGKPVRFAERIQAILPTAISRLLTSLPGGSATDAADANISISALQFSQLAMKSAPERLKNDQSRLLNLFQQISSSGATHITAQELATAPNRVPDPILLDWLLSLCDDTTGRKEQSHNSSTIPGAASTRVGRRRSTIIATRRARRLTRSVMEDKISTVHR